MDVMNTVRRVGSLPGVRSIALRPPVRKALAQVLMVRFVAAAWDTTTPWTLIRREYFQRGSVREYQLRNSSEKVWLKHGQDLEALYELIHRNEYEVPAVLRPRLAKESLSILDVGANIGMFSAWALSRWPTAAIVAFEPEPDNASIYSRWADGRTGAQLVEAAASNADGELKFRTGVGSGSYVTDAADALSVPAVDVFPFLHDADFAKIDVEGGEWSILTDDRLAELKDLVLVMEYHRHMAPYWPPRDAAIEYLTKAGFSTGYERPNYWGHGILWAWKD